MKELLSYIDQTSNQGVFYYDRSFGFMTEIGNYAIYLDIKPSDDELADEIADDPFFKDVDILAGIFERSGLASVRIALVEYLGSRSDLVYLLNTAIPNDDEESTDDDSDTYEDTLPNAVRNDIFDIIRKLNQENASWVIGSSFDVYDPSEGYCEGDDNYAGYIDIDPTLFDLAATKFIIDLLKRTEVTEIPLLYCQALLIKDPPRNIFRPQFLNTNTKVRRLGYLKAFFRWIGEKQKLSEALLDRKFEDFALQYQGQLTDASNDKGLIISANGRSAAPYIALLKELDLVTVINRAVVPTKWLRTYLTLRVESPDRSENIFRLDELDKLFLLETLLRTDFLYISVLLELIFVNSSISYSRLNGIFQRRLLEKLKTIEDENYYGNQRSSDQIKEMFKRVSAWKKPKVYLEHLLMPRLNWLLDLELVDFTDQGYCLTLQGERLFREINYWGDIVCSDVADSTDFLWRYFPQIFAKIYQDSYGAPLEKASVVQQLRENIDRSFEKFKTLAPNRVTSSQAITYSKYKFFLAQNRTISGKTHEHLLESELKDTFVYKYQSQYEDGYIQKVIR